MSNSPLLTSIVSELPDTLEGCHALIGELLYSKSALLQRLAELEERIKLNSRNSSKSPSSDGTAARGKVTPGKPKSDRKRGAQPGHQGHTRPMVDESELDKIVVCPPPPFCACGGTIHQHGHPVLHQVFDLPPLQPIVTGYRRQGGVCGNCNQYVLATLPHGVPSGQLGPRTIALIGTLAGQFHLSQHKIHALLRQVFGLDFSIGTISAAHGTVSTALAPVCEEIKQAIQQESIKHADETSHSSHGYLMWLWAMVTSWGATFQIQPSRGQLAAKKLLGEKFEGVLISDRYSGYNWVDIQQRQLCWSHLLRDFRRIGDREGLPGILGRSLLSMGLLMFRYRHEACSREAYLPLQRRIRRVLERAANQESCTRTAKTCGNLLKMWPALWRFLDQPDIEPTNNRAERAIRGVVIRRKISFVTRSGRGLRFVERAFSVAYTCSQQGKVFFDVLCDVLAASFSGTPPPSLVPKPA
jgi:transposase